MSNKLKLFEKYNNKPCFLKIMQNSVNTGF